MARTVRCSWCYERGHNRAGCDEFKKYIAENPDGYYARKEKSKVTNKKPRKCSYCGKPGHTKRTCEVLKTDSIAVAARSATWRKSFLERCHEVGFGIGTLLRFRDAENFSKWTAGKIDFMSSRFGSYGMVVGFESNQLDHRNVSRRSNSVIVLMSNGHKRSFDLPIEFADLVDDYSPAFFEIAGKIDTSNLESYFSTHWYEGTDDINFHLRI